MKRWQSWVFVCILGVSVPILLGAASLAFVENEKTVGIAWSFSMFAVVGTMILVYKLGDRDPENATITRLRFKRALGPIRILIFSFVAMNSLYNLWIHRFSVYSPYETHAKVLLLVGLIASVALCVIYVKEWMNRRKIGREQSK